MKVFPITIIGLTMLPVFAEGCADRLADKRAAIAELIGKEVVVGGGVVHPGDTVSHTFELYNSGDTPLTVQGLIPSCDCTSASISADTIAAGGKALLTMTLTADTVNGSFSRHIDLYFHEKENPRRFTLYGFIQK